MGNTTFWQISMLYYSLSRRSCPLVLLLEIKFESKHYKHSDYLHHFERRGILTPLGLWIWRKIWKKKKKKLKGKALNKSSKETLTMGFTCLFHKEKKTLHNKNKDPTLNCTLTMLTHSFPFHFPIHIYTNKNDMQLGVCLSLWV